jgi:tRNA (guanine37-N1)-methyltransferase
MITPPVISEHEAGRILLDKERFKKTLLVPSIRIEKQKLNDILFLLKPSLLKQLHQPGIIDDEEKDDFRHVLLNPDRVKSVSDLGEEACRKMVRLQIPDVLHFREVILTYENMKIDEILSQLLPQPLSGWSTIGHIVHLNLKEYHLPYKYVIGQVLLDKLRPAIKLVVNKVSTIENKFRIFPMEVLARESDDVTTIVETKSVFCRFKFDFAAVYWNPRLNTEHERIIETLRPGMDVLYDVFAGVGPFSIPVAKRKCKVLANDLNPDSYKWLQHNVILNKVTQYHSSFCMDGREFLRTIVRDDLIAEWKARESGDEPKIKRFAITMNLPQLAIEFLSSFVGWFDDQEDEIRKLQSPEMPVVHCYTFIKGVPEDDCEKAAVDAAQAVLGVDLKSNFKEVRLVRKVSPDKFFTRISFTLPLEVCFSKARSTKKLKTDDSE